VLKLSEENERSLKKGVLKKIDDGCTGLALLPLGKREGELT